MLVLITLFPLILFGQDCVQSMQEKLKGKADGEILRDIHNECGKLEARKSHFQMLKQNCKSLLVARSDDLNKNIARKIKNRCEDFLSEGLSLLEKKFDKKEPCLLHACLSDLDCEKRYHLFGSVPPSRCKAYLTSVVCSQPMKKRFPKFARWYSGLKSSGKIRCDKVLLIN